jgi:hypothetical protein
VSGWRFTGERFLSLFKIDDKNVLPVQRRLAGVRGSLGRAVIDLEPLLGWRSSNAVVQGYLQNVYQAIDEAQNYLDVLLDMVKQEVDRQ